jgi:hypothetical protein
MGEVRYIVTVRGDSAHGLEIHMRNATKVMLGAHAPYPAGGGTDILSVERAPRGDGGQAVMLWDGHDRAMCPDCEGRGTQLSRLAEAIQQAADVDALTAERLAGDVLGDRTATRLREQIAAHVEAIAENYPEDVFPADGTSRDAIGGTAMARELREETEQM